MARRPIDDQYRCTATAKSTGNRCTRAKHPGANICSTHGLTKAGRAKAAVRVAEEKAQGLLASFDVKPVGDYFTALDQLAARILRFEEVFAEQVDKLSSLRYGTEGGEQLRAEVAVYERAMDRALKVLAEIHRLNLSERLVRVHEQQQELLRVALTETLNELGLSREQQQEATRGIARRLRAVAS